MFTRSTTIFTALSAIALLTIGSEALAQQGPPIDGGATGGGGTGGGGDPTGGAPPGGSGLGPLLLIGGFFVIMIIMTSLSSRKEKKKQQQMLDSLTRHDKVMTNGGMIGVISDVRDDEIVLKVDESTNTRVRFTKSAVKTVLKHASDSVSDAPESDELSHENESDESRQMESAAV